MRPCPQCGAVVPDIEGAVHNYVPSSPGCWMTFGQVQGDEARRFGHPVAHRIVVDAYMAQHPGDGTDRRDRQSVFVHLVGLCAVLEAGMTRTRATKLLGTVVAQHDDFPVVRRSSCPGSSEDLLDGLEKAGVDINTKVQPPHAPGGRFPKDRFAIDLGAGTVTCLGRVTVRIRPAEAGGGTAAFGAAAPTARSPRSAPAPRTGAPSPSAATRPSWPGPAPGRPIQPGRPTRPKVERKIGHLMRRRHGGRRARVRGRPKVGADFALLAAAVNVARFGVLGIIGGPNRNWVVAPD